MAATRSGQWFLQGLSPRAGIAIMRAASRHFKPVTTVGLDDKPPCCVATAAHPASLVPVITLRFC
jgi:hypothetical protein